MNQDIWWNNTFLNFCFKVFKLLLLWFHWNFAPYWGFNKRQFFLTCVSLTKKTVFTLNRYSLNFCRLLAKAKKFVHIKRRTVVCESELNANDALLKLYIQWKPIHIFKFHRWNWIENIYSTQFGAFSLTFTLDLDTMQTINNQNATELFHCIIIFKYQESKRYFTYTYKILLIPEV